MKHSLDAARAAIEHDSNEYSHRDNEDGLGRFPKQE
jgi:hypothetical protein